MRHREMYSDLLKDSLHRLSIDVDIICSPGTEIEKYLDKISSHWFTRVVPTGKARKVGRFVKERGTK